MCRQCRIDDLRRLDGIGRCAMNLCEMDDWSTQFRDCRKVEMEDVEDGEKKALRNKVVVAFICIPSLLPVRVNWWGEGVTKAGNDARRCQRQHAAPAEREFLDERRLRRTCTVAVWNVEGCAILCLSAESKSQSESKR